MKLTIERVEVIVAKGNENKQKVLLKAMGTEQECETLINALQELCYGDKNKNR